MTFKILTKCVTNIKDKMFYENVHTKLKYRGTMGVQVGHKMNGPKLLRLERREKG